tara:strand:+ start:3754 stop:4386 length:633 start_codon:yes stop_codon:yes gene_type:complete
MAEENINIQQQLETQEESASPAQSPGTTMSPGMDMSPNQGGIDPFDAPTPGASLTSNPEGKLPYEQAPEHTDVRTFMEEFFLTITEKEQYIDLLGFFMRRQPIEELVQTVLYSAMSKGKINPDLMLLLIEPVSYLLIALAEQAEIEPVLYEGEEADEMTDESKELYISESKNVREIKEPRRTSVEPSLLAKVKELPTAEELKLDQEEEDI